MQRSIVQLSPDENYSSVGTSWKYHSIKTAYPMKIESEFAIENGPVEIVSFSMKKWWIFPVRYVNVYQRVNIKY